MATDIEIFVGTSQDFLLSFKVKKTDKDDFALERFIAHRCHNGQIISMDTCGRYLATGGGDDRIVVIDLKLNRDVHEIISHEGSINSLAFTNKGSDLLSGSEDGRLVATTVGSWKPVNIWKKPHTGKAVLKVCLHQSDKFALTLGKDGTLRGWDMFRGTQINTFNTKHLSNANIILDNIELCPNGNIFAMSGAKTVAMYNLSRDEPYDDVTLKSRVTSMCWLDDDNLLIGMENGSIEWTSINNWKNVNIPNIHTRRIKGMHHLNGFLGTICSAGNISLYGTTIAKKKLTLICTAIDESVRPTCIKLINITKNRYKQVADIPASDSKEILSRSGAKRKPILTTGKLIVEMDGGEKNDVASTNENWRLQVTEEDTDTEIVITPERKTPKKKRVKSTNGHVPIFTPATQTLSNATPKSSKRKAVATKPIAVRSLNSDDDFEKSGKTFSKKKKSITSETVIETKQPAKKKAPTRQKSHTKNERKRHSNFSLTDIPSKSNASSASLHDDVTSIAKEEKMETQQAHPAIIKQKEISQKLTKERRKSFFKEDPPLPTHLMATRNKRKTM